jgi:N-acetylglutamate synthase-like GNAT family acetyltransferase/2-polyprenyl-3-methyl-5-hydroxy-6-metoxy-1,4-benzoquinol methylase
MTEEKKRTSEEDIKAAVRQRYAAAIAQPSGSCCGPAPVPAESGCCGPRPSAPVRPQSSCCGPAATEMQGTAARMAGYQAAELQNVPADAVSNSFGCGNPLAFAGVRPGETVLDIGSGAGIDCFLAADKVGPAGRVIGLDMTPEMVERARRNAREAGRTNVEFRLGDAEKMPVEDGSVDWVVSNCVINLSPDKPAVFREIARVLRPGGRISISDIVAEELPEAIRTSREAWSACLAGAISESAYVRGLAQAGLAAVRASERLVYDASQLEFLFGKSPCGCPGADAAGLAKEAAGKIWSARFAGIKPQPGDVRANIFLERAQPADVPAIQALLQEAGLPSDIAAQAGEFLVARHAGRIVGCIGMEPAGAAALFRSLAVAPAYRGLGLSHRLFEALELRARGRGVEEAYLLTQTIEPLALRWGFRRVERSQVPPVVLQTSEFRGACCTSAAAMVKRLRRDAGCGNG